MTTTNLDHGTKNQQERELQDSELASVSGGATVLDYADTCINYARTLSQMQDSALNTFNQVMDTLGREALINRT